MSEDERWHFERRNYNRSWQRLFGKDPTVPVQKGRFFCHFRVGHTQLIKGNIYRARARALLLSSSGVDDPFRLFLLLFLFWNTTFNLNFFFDNYLDHIQLIVLFNSLRLWLSFFWRSFCNARRSSSDKGSSCLINMIFIFVGAFSNILSNF